MSADLLAAFGPQSSASKQHEKSAEPEADPELEDDAWGDFESARTEIASSALRDLSITEAGAAAHASVLPATPIVGKALATTWRDDDLIESVEDLAPVSASIVTSKNHFGREEPTRETTDSRAEVLFDATEEQEEDDFGDFESVSPPQTLASQSMSQPKPRPSLSSTTPTIDLLGLNLPPSAYPEAPKSPSFQERNPFGDLSISTKTEKTSSKSAEQPSPTTAWPTFESARPDGNDDEGWEKFLDSPFDEGGSVAKERKASVPKTAAMSLKMESDRLRRTRNTSTSNPDDARGRRAPERRPSNLSSFTTTSSSVDSNIRPTNIPPPSVLLLLFPPLFKRPIDITRPTAERPTGPSSKALPLLLHIQNAQTAARIIAGRKHRWKRDTHLAQMTKIGPAASSAGRSGAGMKLTSVDKTETAREEREVAEVCGVWRTQAGRVRAALAGSTASSAMTEGSDAVPASYPPLPDLDSTIPVVKAKASSDVLTAPHPCALCGLNRDERLAKIDGHVEDSFGEWWVDHWGHAGCRMFWEREKEHLPAR